MLPNTRLNTHLLDKSTSPLLKWHNRLSHMHVGKIQDLARQGKLPKVPPICHSCQYGKARRRPSAPHDAASPIDSDGLQPGDKVSVD